MLCGIYKNVLNFLLNHTPTASFLSDIAMFEGVILALAIPLSFEIISRISERYQSEVITKKFFDVEWTVKWLPVFLIVNIIFAVALRFFVSDTLTSLVWRLFAWVTFAGFLFVAMIFLIFLKRLKRYISEPEFILDELFDEAKKLLE